MYYWRVRQLNSIAAAPFLSNVVVISGFWRSGTTWLQQQVRDAMNAKTIFEPLSPEGGHVWDALPKDASQADSNIYMPPTLSSMSAKDLKVLKDALLGVGRYHFTYYLESSVDGQLKNKLVGQLKNKLVVKFTRAGFILEDLSRMTTWPILHIRRHPAAVFASLKNTNWPWNISDINVSKAFSLNAVRGDEKATAIFELLNRYNHSSAAFITAYWALSEKHAQKAIEDETATLLDYNELVDGAIQISDVLRSCGMDPKFDVQADIPSAVTSEGRDQLSPAQRKNDWQNRLNDEELADIEKTLSDVYPQMLKTYPL